MRSVAEREGGVELAGVAAVERQRHVAVAGSVPGGGAHRAVVDHLHRSAILHHQRVVERVVAVHVVVGRRVGELRPVQPAVVVVERCVGPVVVELRHIVEIYHIVAVGADGVTAVDQRVDACCDGRAEGYAEDGAEHRTSAHIVPAGRGHRTVVCAEEGHRMTVAVAVMAGRTRGSRRAMIPVASGAVVAAIAGPTVVGAMMPSVAGTAIVRAVVAIAGTALIGPVAKIGAIDSAGTVIVVGRAVRRRRSIGTTGI